MGCEGSKERPSGAARPQPYQHQYDQGVYRQPQAQPQPTYHQPAQPRYDHQPAMNNTYNHQPAMNNTYNNTHNTPPSQNPYHSTANQEHQEVEMARTAIARANSLPPQRPPQPVYAAEQPMMYETPRENMNRQNTARLLNQQKYASVDQLQEVYPTLDREVIRGVINDCNGDQERCHAELSELSGNQGSPSPPHGLGRSMSGSPNRQGSFWEVGAAVDANYQGQWYSAVVEGVENNGDYRVKWTSDGTCTLVTPEDLRNRQGLTNM
eukprot:TRINITY_DN27036_c0_g1_i1.p1 TRINITY_DN27036_c0_g1~~TRINITY_DN27036_c0_g1_i1.p1  ORF type:complete len:281 (+),score=52.25 TRINITY_DN27036_c0_g1_i1:46-843(+)